MDFKIYDTHNLINSNRGRIMTRMLFIIMNIERVRARGIYK
jgi:hypothetical protein